jgi:hypothetical protein
MVGMGTVIRYMLEIQWIGRWDGLHARTYPPSGPLFQEGLSHFYSVVRLRIGAQAKESYIDCGILCPYQVTS